MQSWLSKRQHRWNSSAHTFDWWIFILVFLLVGFGLLMIYEASSVAALRTFGDRYHFLREQLKWALVGSVCMICAIFFPYKKLHKLSLPLLLLTIVLLIVVLIPGFSSEVLGAKRWINLFYFQIQPAEFAKLALVVYLAAWLSHFEKSRLRSFLVVLGTVVGLVMLEPDLGTAIVIVSIAGIVYFTSGAPLFHVFLLLPLVLGGALFLSVTAPYRVNRLVTFFNPNIDPLGTSYHVRQVLISLGSGGWLGVGLGKSLQKYDYLPEAMTDSIFAIIGEEFGFIGSCLLVGIFLLLLIRGFKVAAQAPDKFSKLLALGIVVWIGMQSIINLSTMVVLLPLTGIPLPFISYGGSSLIVMMTGIGILLNISRVRQT